jgi:hypothetical protein
VIEHAALTSSRQRDVDPEGDFEAELRSYVRGVVRVMSDPVTQAALPGMLLDLQADPEVQERYHEAFAPSMRAFAELVQLAVADGIVAKDTTADEINLLVTGVAMGTMLDPGKTSRANLEAVIFKLVSRAIGLDTTPRT